MSNIKQSDLFIVGRNDSSYNVPFSDILVSVGGDTIPDLNNDNKQPDTLDQRYVNVLGDTMSGRLDIEVTSGAGLRVKGGFAFKKDGEDIDGSNLFYSGPTRVSYEGLTENDNDIVNVGFVRTITNAVQDELNDVEVEINDIKADIIDINTGLQNEIDRATDKENEILAELTTETNRAQDAESKLDDRINNLVLDELADVTVGGVSDNQVLFYNQGAGEWQAKEIHLSSSLEFKGEIDLTAPPIVANNGELYVNDGVGAVDTGFGQLVIDALPGGAVGGELVAYSDVDGWIYVGTVGGGLTYDAFSADNLPAIEGSNGKGELSYNPSTGVFSFREVDLNSRIPMNLGSLSPLPA